MHIARQRAVGMTPVLRESPAGWATTHTDITCSSMTTRAHRPHVTWLCFLAILVDHRYFGNMNLINTGYTVTRITPYLSAKSYTTTAGDGFNPTENAYFHTFLIRETLQ